MKKEQVLKGIFLFAASVAILTIILIFVFIAVRGVPIFFQVPLTQFLFGTNWSPMKGNFGALPLIVGSFLVTLGAVVIGAPLGIAVAIFLSEIASPKAARFVRPTVELLAGIPSVIYGFFGIMVIIPLVRNLIGGAGFGLISASLVLAVMILPTIAALTEDTIRSLPRAHKWGSLALGATQWQTIKKVILPSASEGILSAVILGIGRAIGETMAVLMVVGNAPIIPTSIRDPFATMTSVIALDMSYASGQHQQALFAVALILFIISMSLVAVLRLVSRQRSAH